MAKLTWETKLAVVLVAMSLCIYSFKLVVLKNPQDTENYIFNSLGFLPISVLLVTLVLNKLLAIQSRREKLAKMNMVIGTFFTEVGSPLIKEIAAKDPDIGKLKESLLVRDEWTAEAFEKYIMNNDAKSTDQPSA